MKENKLQRAVDLDALAAYLNDAMKNKELSVRAAAEQIGCSAATLTRLLKGSDSDTVPDSINLMRAAAWLGKNLSDFEPRRLPQASSLAEIEVHLRALPGIDRTDAAALMDMVRAGYELARRGSKRAKNKA
jgi:transcriptional regulator with XRE-family HTH domain